MASSFFGECACMSERVNVYVHICSFLCLYLYLFISFHRNGILAQSEAKICACECVYLFMWLWIHRRKRFTYHSSSILWMQFPCTHTTNWMSFKSFKLCAHILNAFIVCLLLGKVSFWIRYVFIYILFSLSLFFVLMRKVSKLTVSYSCDALCIITL